MIRINLLPAEYRQPEGPPPGRLAVIFIDLVVLGSAVSYFLVMVLVTVPAAREKRSAIQEKLSTANKELKQLEGVRVRISAAEVEGAFLDRIAAERRTLWSRELLERLHEALGAERAWIETLAAAPALDGASRLRASFAVAGDDFARVRSLRRALEGRGWSVESEQGLVVEERDYSDAKTPYAETVHLTLPLGLARAGDGR